MFPAIVSRPALPMADDRTRRSAMGRVHDPRPPQDDSAGDLLMRNEHGQE